jgi:hypothetical protein
LLGNNSVNNDHSYAVAITVTLGTTEQRNGVFWQIVPKGYKLEDLLDMMCRDIIHTTIQSSASHVNKAYNKDCFDQLASQEGFCFIYLGL